MSLEGNLKYAEELLKHFVGAFGIIYGDQFIYHNVHVLLHLADDVRKFGPLDGFCAFKFENHMKYLKSILRKQEKPLQLLVKIHEEKNKLNKKPSTKKCFKIWKKMKMDLFQAG